MLNRIWSTRKNRLRLGLVLVGLIFLLIVVYVALADSAVPAESAPEVMGEVAEPVSFPGNVEVSTEPIDEETYVWEGKENEPMKLSIPKIQVSAFIEKSGVYKENNEVGVPSNTNLVGWFKRSAKPGKKGLSILTGHYDSPTGAGVFLFLNQLQSGDEFTVQMGNGTILKYRVRKLMTVNADKAVNYLFSQESDIKSQLNLVTCGGAYYRDGTGYEDRTIVFSELISQ